MAQDIITLVQMFFAFGAICFWLMYKYSDLIYLHVIMMIIWFMIFPSTITYLENDGWNIYLHLGMFLLIEYLAFMNIVHNFLEIRRMKKRKKGN